MYYPTQTKTVDKVHFEYLGEDQTVEGAKVWKVEAIHVTTTRNKRKFTQAELEASGRSLSFRPLNINHDRKQSLPFPDNMTMAMNFNPATRAVEGAFRVADPTINAMIESSRIRQVSIEQIPTAGESCNEFHCEQHGVAFIGMALLESDVMPGDPMAHIKLESLIVPDAQRECADCTDFVPCEKCAHTAEADQCVTDAIREVKAAHPDMDRDQVIAIALSKCGKSKSAEAWAWYEYIIPKYESIN